MELSCKVQNYEWGKKGASSTVANLYKGSDSNFNIEENVPYAELWMGTHVNAPSVIKSTKQSLLSLIKENPQYLGQSVSNVFGQELPFLFKILSVNKALSIQAHPAKRHAEELHKQFPDIYKDPNHKPELAIALTPFEALCGFRPVADVRQFIKDVPELHSIVGNDILNIQDDTCFLQKSFKTVLTCDKNKIKDGIEKLINRLATSNDKEKYLYSLIIKLNNEFPNDVGIFMVYFLNYLKLKPSESLYLGANEPHAYLSGDCVECMACSDNVVRAGLTPKFIDVETLCSMLIYRGENATDKLFKPINEDEYTNIYKPPVPDFAVAEIKLTCVKSYETIKRNSASILIVISGSGSTSEGIQLKSGTIVFLPADKNISINVTEPLLIYQALANV